MFTVRRHFPRSFLCAVLCMLSLTASADVLVQYLFWDSMGSALGRGMQSMNDYRNERQLWKDKVAENQRRLEQCGNCSQRAEIEKELRYWQNTEEQFQKIAGSLAASVGMSATEARLLDIELPLAPPMNEKAWKELHAVVRKEWVDDRPPFCQAAVDTHLQCLRDHQERTGVQSLDLAKQPGGACYDTGKLFRHCANEDYTSFELETNLQATRRAGQIIPEFVDNGSYEDVYYGPVPNDFVPSLPAEILLGELKEMVANGYVRLTTRKTASDVIGTVVIERFFWNRILPESQCFAADRPTDELSRRVCNDLTDLSFYIKPPLLACQYTGPGGAEGAIESSPRFWFGSRPDEADPVHLLKRHANHPVLSIGAPRTQCPTTLDEAEAALADWQAKLATLRMQTEQIPVSVALPKSEWSRQQNEDYRVDYEEEMKIREATSSVRLEGTYDFEVQVDGIAANGTCDISFSSMVENDYLLRCHDGTTEHVIEARVPTRGYLQLMWRLSDRPERTPVNYMLDSANPNALVSVAPTGGARGGASGSGRLVRTGDLLPLTEFPVVGVYEFERSVKGSTERGRCEIAQYERYIPPPFSFSCTTPDGKPFRNTAAHRENALYISWSSLNDSSMAGLVFIVDRDFDPNRPETHVLTGRNSQGASVRLVRTGDLVLEGSTIASTSSRRVPEAPEARATAPATAIETPVAESRPCVVEEIAGEYPSSFGPMRCEAVDGGISCCYGGGCKNSVQLQLDEGGRGLTGAWTYPNGKTGPALFGLTAQCAMSKGKWGYSADKVTGTWNVGNRTK